MKTIRVFISICMVVMSYNNSSFAQEKIVLNADQALQKLLEGNKRFIDVKTVHPDQTVDRRTEVAKSQSPFAVIISCSDSRVPPEIIFDQGIGDLFIIRTAGNVVDNVELGSIEYAAEHLGVNLVMVLGHERCGAVDATVKGGEIPGHIKNVVNAIKPSLDNIKDKSGDLIDKTVISNVKMVVEKLKASKPILHELHEEGKLKVVGARYDLDDGTVTIIE